MIGINSAIYAPTGTTAGIGFAIPVNTARRVAEDLIANGRVRRATLGAEGRAIWPELADALHLRVQQGILIERVTPGGPAAQAGIRGGTRSVLAGLAGAAHRRRRDRGHQREGVDQPDGFESSAESRRPGDTVTLTIVRDGKKMDMPVKLGES